MAAIPAWTYGATLKGVRSMRNGCGRGSSGSRLGRVHLGEERDAVAHGDADFALGVVGADEGAAGTAEDDAPGQEGCDEEQDCQEKEADD